MTNITTEALERVMACAHREAHLVQAQLVDPETEFMDFLTALEGHFAALRQALEPGQEKGHEGTWEG